MDNLQVIKQLLNGYHLSESELSQAEVISYKISREVKDRKKEIETPNNPVVDLTKINRDTNGNPRYVVHFLTIDRDYETAIKKAKAIGGKKYHNKQYGGGIVFQSYNVQELKEKISRL